ncbi:MAG: hypothetical protein ACTHLL_05855 [Candidatus Nitrosocosmicus sp.]
MFPPVLYLLPDDAELLSERYSKNHFKHDLGENWSLYHKTILESICHDILSVPIKILTTDSTFMIEYDEENTMYAK